MMTRTVGLLAVILIFTFAVSICLPAFADDSELAVSVDAPFEGPRIVGVLPPSLSVLGIVRLPELRLTALKLSRGETIEVFGVLDGLYYFRYTDGMTYCTERELVRLDTDKSVYQETIGYAKYNTCVYPTAYLRGNEFTRLTQNTELTVLDRLGNLMIVSWNGTDGVLHTGYIDAESFSQSRIQDWYPAGGSNSSDGSSSGSGGGTAAPTGGQDGGDILLAFQSGKTISAEKISYSEGSERYFSPAMGTVFADGTNAYLVKTLKRGEELLVASENGDNDIVWLDGVLCEIDREAIRLAEEDVYEPWVGYIQPNGVLFLSPESESEGRKETTNTEVLVEDEYHDMYIVSLNGEYYCVGKDAVKSSKYWYDPSWNSGGSSGSSGSSSEAASGGSAGNGQQWTDPVF